MNFLTSKIPDEFLEHVVEDEAFKGQDGNYYYYQVSLDEDDIVMIKDTCGRYMPLDLSDLASMTNVFNRLVKFSNDRTYYSKVLHHNLVNGVST